MGTSYANPSSYFPEVARRELEIDRSIEGCLSCRATAVASIFVGTTPVPQRLLRYPMPASLAWTMDNAK